MLAGAAACTVLCVHHNCLTVTGAVGQAALTVAARLSLQLKIFTAWTNTDSAATSFLVKVFKGAADVAPNVDVTAATALVRS